MPTTLLTGNSKDILKLFKTLNFGLMMSKEQFNQIYNYHFPTPILFGPNASKEVPQYINSLNLKKPFIVSDPNMAELPLFKEFYDLLVKNNLKPTVYNGISKNPVKSDAINGAASFNRHQCDMIIGFGGGASMDVARAIALAANHERDLFDFDDSKGGDQFVTEDIPPFITIPTTCGTGSEVGRSTVIADDETHVKKVLFSPRLMAQKVFADPLLTMELPPAITAATGMDALSHNLEAFVSKGFSPLCDGIATEAIRLISESLENAVHQPDLESRSKMMMASLMGATAFQKGLGIVHSLAHPLSTVFDTHHGLANAVMLPFGIDFNKSSVEERFAYLSKVIGKGNDYLSFKDWVMDLNQSIKMPKSLKALNYDNNQIPKLAELAFQDVCHSSNPRAVSQDDFQSIYNEAFEC